MFAGDRSQPTRFDLQVYALGKSQRHLEFEKRAAFGFGSIAKNAGQQLAPYLPDIVPKLYRFVLHSFLFKLHF